MTKREFETERNKERCYWLGSGNDRRKKTSGSAQNFLRYGVNTLKLDPRKRKGGTCQGGSKPWWGRSDETSVNPPQWRRNAAAERQARSCLPNSSSRLPCWLHLQRFTEGKGETEIEIRWRELSERGSRRHAEHDLSNSTRPVNGSFHLFAKRLLWPPL